MVTLQALARRAQSTLHGRAASDFIVTSTGNLAIAALSALGGILAARLLGPEGRGELAAAVVWASILGTAAQTGLPQALTYFAARRSDSLGSIYRAMLFIYMLQSIAVLLFGWVAVGLILSRTQPGALLPVRVYLFSIPLAIPITYMSTIAQGVREFRVFRALRVSASVAYVLSFGIAYVLGVRDAQRLVYLLLATQLITLVGGFLFFHRHVQPQGPFEWPWVGRLLRYGLKTYLGSLSWIANARIDQFIMSAFVSLSSLGNYAVAVSYAGVVYPLLSAVAMTLFPHVASSAWNNAGRKIAIALGVSLLISCSGAVVLGLLSRLAIPALFGAQYGAAVTAAVILLAGTIFLGGNYVLSDGLRGLGHPLTTSIAELAGLAATLVGLYLLLPTAGINGAAWASVLSYGITFVILLFGLSRALHGADMIQNPQSEIRN